MLLGNDRFKQESEKMLGQKIGQSRRGRLLSKPSGTAIDK